MRETDYTYGKAAIGICIEKMEKDNFQGTMHTPYRKENNPFYDVVEFLLLLDEISEERGFPNAMYKNRSLKKKTNAKRNGEFGKLLRTKEQMKKSYKNPATFMVYVTARKHGGLQGHMICMGTGKVIKYQSELELIHLMEVHWRDEIQKEELELVL